jgi:hypothetical protein
LWEDDLLTPPFVDRGVMPMAHNFRNFEG